MHPALDEGVVGRVGGRAAVADVLDDSVRVGELNHKRYLLDNILCDCIDRAVDDNIATQNTLSSYKFASTHNLILN